MRLSTHRSAFTNHHIAPRDLKLIHTEIHDDIDPKGLRGHWRLHTIEWSISSPVAVARHRCECAHNGLGDAQRGPYGTVKTLACRGFAVLWI